jgi:mannan endo-1,4-beta-mannosidase
VLFPFALAATLATATAIPAGAFVTVDGNHFSVGGRPFAFVGANLDVMHGQARAHAAATIAAAASDGLTVGRIWALGEGDAQSPPWSRANQLFRVAPDQWLDAADVQLDRVLASAREHGLRVIITLSNNWDDFGGIRQYLAWAGLPSDGFGDRDAFFRDARTRAFYRAHLMHLLGRINSVNGTPYVDDPTIFAWELMNESMVATPEGAAARAEWIESMARFIRARDGHHLVTPGVMGYTSRQERAQWLDVCRLPSVDYCDSHLYPETTDHVASLTRLEAYIDDRVQLAQHVARKPIVFGEFGFHTDRAEWLARPRAEWFERFLARAVYDGAAGALAWIYQPWSGHARDFGIYVDRADTDDVRAQMRTYARLMQAAPTSHNPRLSDLAGDRLLYDPYVTEARSPHQHLQDGVIAIPPAAFAGARWERLGSWGSGADAHAFGGGDGWFEYVFTLDRAATPTVVARLSSEWPGNRAPIDGGSRVLVRVDDTVVTRIDVIPDDGHGRAERVTLPRLSRGRHVLRLEVPAGARAHGLCVYGDEQFPLRLTLTK